MPELTPASFDLRQALIVAWTLGAFGVLASAMYEGLLGAPDMQVQGNGSSATSLVWFSDRTGPALPTAAAVSAPLLVYRAAMLAWALWAAFAVLRWIRWGWGAFTEGGAWKKAPPRPPPAPAPPPAPPPPVPQGYGPPPPEGPPPGAGDPPPAA